MWFCVKPIEIVTYCDLNVIFIKMLFNVDKRDLSMKNIDRFYCQERSESIHFGNPSSPAPHKNETFAKSAVLQRSQN